MRKFLSIFLAILLTVTMFTSCANPVEALASVYLNLGEKYLTDLDYEEAIVYFNKVIEAEPRNSRAYMGAAEAYVGLGDTKSAIELLKTALEVFSDDEEVAIEFLEMLIEIDSDTTQWYFELAGIYEDLCNISLAVDTLKLGLNNFEDDATKINFLDELIEIDETNEEWYMTIAYIYINQNDAEDAIASLKEGLEKASDTNEIEELLNQLAPDTTGLVQTSSYYYYEDGSLRYGYEYKYTSDGDVEECTYYSEGMLRYISKYNSYGKESQITYYNSSGEISNRNVYQYDTNGNPLKEVMYSSDGSISGWDEYECSEEGLVLKVTEYLHGAFLCQYEFEYDEYGNVLLREEKDYYGNIIEKISYEYVYDDFENVKSSVASYEEGGWQFADNNGEYHLTSKIIEEYEYNDFGNITSYKCTYESSDGTTMSGIEEYEYDASNNLIAASGTAYGVTTSYVVEREYEYGSEDKVQKCVITWYYAASGNTYSIETLERVAD